MLKKIMLNVYMVALGLGVAFSSQAIAADKYEIDLVHSNIGFGVKHLTVSTVTGNFKDYAGTIEFDPKDASAFKADVTIQASSISTNNEARDNHLRSADFFDAEKFPIITFQSKKLEQNGEGYILTGDLTVKGVTKEVSIPVGIAGPVAHPMGGTVIGLGGQVVINRQDYGVSWNKTLDTGGMVVDNNVTISVEIEAHKK